MKLPVPCKNIFSLDISEIKKITNEITEKEWDYWNTRQENFDVHSQTKSYPLMNWDLKYYEIYNTCKVTLLNKSTLLWNPINKVKKKLESYYGGRCVNILFTLIPPKSYIPEHVDAGKLLSLCHRCHIPIKTNKDVLFFIADQIYNLEEGFCYEISNLDLHRVENNSEENRIHLIMDIAEKKSNIFPQIYS